MEGHIHVEHHKPILTGRELKKSKPNIWRVIGSFLLDMLPIIFGILIAVSINTKRESNHERKLEKFYLSNIKENLDENVKDLEFDVKYFSEIKNAQKFFTRDGSAKDSLEIENQFSKFFYLVQPQLNNTGFITLQNTGKLDIITNLNIIEDLTKLYQLDVPTLQILMNDYNQKYNNLFLPYLTGTEMSSSIFHLNASDRKKLTSSPQFLSIISLFHLGAIVNKYNEIIAQHRKLSKEIGEALEG